jgi:hypothetical protein
MKCLILYIFVINVFAEEVPVRFGALFRNGNAEKAEPGPLQMTGSTFAKRENIYFKIISRLAPGFFIL